MAPNGATASLQALEQAMNNVTGYYAASFVALREMQPRMRHRLSVPIEAQSEAEAEGKAHIWARQDAPASEGWNIVDVIVVPIELIWSEPT